MRKKWDTYHTRGVRKKYLYRFMDKEKLVDLLTSKSLYLTRMDRFSDDLEGIRTFNITELINNYQIYFDYLIEDKNPNISEKTFWDLKHQAKQALIYQKTVLKKVQSAHFVSCWFNSDIESHAMWSYYAGKGGFAIRFDRKEIQNKIQSSVEFNAPNKEQSVVVGRINYQNFRKVIENEKESQVKYLAFRKDESFEHEKEYRVVVIDPLESLNHKKYQIEGFDELNITIIVDPKTSDTQFFKIKKELKAIKKDVTIKRSQLEPFYQFKERTKLL